MFWHMKPQKKIIHNPHSSEDQETETAMEAETTMKVSKKKFGIIVIRTALNLLEL
jgi:hypothetical protein